jgi:hypothetical protein
MSGTGDHLSALEGKLTPGNATYSTLYGLYLSNQGGTSTGTFTNSYGIRIDNDWLSTCTVSSNHTGLHIQALSGGTISGTTYGIRILGTAAKNVIAGQLRIGSDAVATHLLEVAAGTTAIAPLKLTSGTSLTTAIAGCIEFTTDDFFATITTGAARKAFILDDGARLTSGKIPIATTNGRLINLTASAAYTPTNVTTDRSYDANSTSIDELADVLGTVIADLQAKGILG